MKPLNEAEARAALDDPRWPRRLCGTERKEAAYRMGLSFLERTAARHGEDPTVVLDAVRADTPLARTVRGLLRIPPDLPPRSGRPSKVSERLHEYFTIERIRAEGLKGDRVFIEALARLPGRTMTVESLKRTYQHTKKRMTVPAEMKALIKIVEVTKPD